MMTRKQFEAIAQAFREIEGDYDIQACNDVSAGIIKYLAESIADVCADNNPNFDRERFIKACGL